MEQESTTRIRNVLKDYLRFFNLTGREGDVDELPNLYLHRTQEDENE